MQQFLELTGCRGCCVAEDHELVLIERTVWRHHAELLSLCRDLEAFADKLPDMNDRQKTLVLARGILPTMRRSHEYEENVLFVLFEDKAQNCPLLHHSLERLRFEHWEDDAYATEVSDGLTAYAAHSSRTTAETLGYMLRGFYEGVRRHVAFEMEHIMPRLRTCGVVTA